MTIDSAYFPEIHLNNGGLVYQFRFEVIDPVYLDVYAISPDGTYFPVDPANYIVELNDYISPISHGGTITLDAPLGIIPAISIQRKTSIGDDQDFPARQSFAAEAFEFQCDKLTMILQEVGARVCDCAGVVPPLPPPPGPIEASPVFGDPTITHDDSTFESAGLFACDAANTKLWVVPKGFGYVKYSGDAGGSFSAALDVPFADTNSYPISQLQYDAPRGDVWITVFDHNGSNRVNHFYYSSNNGTLWTEANGAPVVYYGHCFYVHTDGALYLLGKSTNAPSAESTAFRLASPKSSPTKTNQVLDGNANTTSWSIVPVNGQLILSVGPESSAGNRAYRTTLILGAEVQVGSNALPNGRIYAFSGTDALYYKAATSNVLTLVLINSAWALSNFDVDFGEAVSAFVIGFGNGKYVIAARRTSDPTQLVVMSAPVGATYPTWTKDIVQLSISQDDASLHRNQIAWWGGSTWLFGYRHFRPAPNNTFRYLVIDKFDL